MAGAQSVVHISLDVQRNPDKDREEGQGLEDVGEKSEEAGTSFTLMNIMDLELPHSQI